MSRMTYTRAMAHLRLGEKNNERTFSMYIASRPVHNGKNHKINSHKKFFCDFQVEKIKFLPFENCENPLWSCSK